MANSAPFRLPTFFAAWIVPAGMKRTSPGLSVTGGFPSTSVLQRRPFENIDDFFTRMRVPDGRHPRVEFDDRLDDLASGDAEIVPLEIDAYDSCLLRPRHVQNQTARDDDRRHHRHSRRSHVNLFPLDMLRQRVGTDRDPSSVHTNRWVRAIYSEFTRTSVAPRRFMP